MKNLPKIAVGLAVWLTVFMAWMPTPVQPSPAASTTLVVSEVMYDPLDIEPDEEWIEIYNLGGAPIDLTNYKVGDEETSGGTEGMLRFPGGASIAPGQVIVVANKSSAFLDLYGFKPDYEMLESDPAVPDMENYTPWTDGSLALQNDGDEVLLLNASDDVIDVVSWGTSNFAFDPPAPDVAAGHSLERRPADGDTDAADDWVDQTTPDPGRVLLGSPRVITTADSGPGSLRQALLQAAPNSTITFDLAVFPPGNPATISLRSALPPLIQDYVSLDASNAGVILDGSLITDTTANGLVISDTTGIVVKGLQILYFPDDGIDIVGGAQNVTIGGDRSIGDGPMGQGNLISANGDDGIYITGYRASGIVIEGNYIGVDLSGTLAFGNGDDGIHVSQQAHDNLIGGSTAGRRNLISGNGNDGVFLTLNAMSNTVRGNYIGTDASGRFALPNLDDGVHLSSGAGYNIIGGTGLYEGNLISGNGSDGLLFTASALSNTVHGNFIGTDASGHFPLPNLDDGVDLSDGAGYNVVGGMGAGEGNLISGNADNGLYLTGVITRSTISNRVRGNYIGTNVDGTAALANVDSGIAVAGYVSHTWVESNTIALNGGSGVEVLTCGGHTISQNAIYSNTLVGIKVQDDCLAPPQFISLSVGLTETVTGTTVPNARVEFFSDDGDQGRIYEGYTLADATGRFSFSQTGGFAGPNLTLTSTDPEGNTSEFREPTHLMWTVLLYLDGDNDLEAFMFNTMTNTVAADLSPQVNVLALVDGWTSTVTYSGTVLYDLSHGAAVPLSTTVASPLDDTRVITGERNMGDGQTLIDFVAWGRARYPARHTLLAIVDHGGGWAPAEAMQTLGVMGHHKTHWMAGGSGLSWDFSDGYDYLDSQEIRQALAAVTDDGADPLDVVFYDVCLMGMVEVAYQIQEYAGYFVSSQNIGWAPWGPGGRYVRTIPAIHPDLSPGQVAALLVQTYADSTPPEGHPFTISALDLTYLPAVAAAADQLALAISQTLTTPDQAEVLYEIYSATQKIDYDSDLQIEPATDGFVDLYDLALQASQQHPDPAVVAAAQSVITALDQTIVAEAHRSGSPWMEPEWVWNLDDAHGLSIFLPLGEDLELPIIITETGTISLPLVVTRNLRLRDTYSADQLRFVADTAWGDLIESYYAVVSSSVPSASTSGPAAGLQMPDVTHPRTVITLTGALTLGRTISVVWMANDTQAGVAGATLWHDPPGGDWAPVLTQTGTSGIFSFDLSTWCENGFAVRARDKAGNVEPLDSGFNTILVQVRPCHHLFMPIVLKDYP